MDNTSTTERTPLLTAPVNTRVPEDPRTSTTTRDNDPADILHEHESFPILSKAVSNVSFGIVEIIPASSIRPDKHGDLRLKNDGSKPRESDRGVDHEGEISFHGGISKRRFWIIFAGMCTLCSYAPPLLIS